LTIFIFINENDTDAIITWPVTGAATPHRPTRIIITPVNIHTTTCRHPFTGRQLLIHIYKDGLITFSPDDLFQFNTDTGKHKSAYVSYSRTTQVSQIH